MVGDRRDVVAIRRRDGTIRWRYDGAAVAAWAELAIATDGSLVAFAQSRGFATVLDAESGIVRWNRRLLPDDPDTWITSPVFLGDVLVYLRRRNGAPRHGDAVAFAVRASTGDSLWTLTVDTLARISDYAGRAVAVDGDIILSLKRGEILRVSTIDGRKMAGRCTGKYARRPPQMVMSGTARVVHRR
jgi:outer membrane protein assembly factor BamB